MKYAIAILDIKPQEFWALTLAEFNVSMEAYEWKMKQERIRNAEQALWTISPHVKPDKLPSPMELAYPEEAKKQKEADREVTTQDDLAAMQARMGN